ncbi:MAG: response regulator, partial [Erysipelotrichaceae bacterium]|nr:response regulator [Erysipelotrichaceae bacterium]
MSDKILVVEDDIDIQKALLIYLKNQGYDVLVASNGLEGLNIINNNEIHLAIVDIMMPIMDGIEMT